ncbi:MAG: beta-1,6-N-acetylglucosaminyltransferase [Thiotrichales bacterium]
MRIAYLITADTAAAPLTRLINRLATPDTSFFVHVDKRRDDLRLEARELLSGRNDVNWVTERHATWAGHVNYVHAVLAAMRALVASGTAYDYALLLTDQDYPIKPAAEIDAYLAAHNGQNFIDHAPVEGKDHVWADWGPPSNGITRLAHWHLVVHSRLLLRIPMARTIPLGHTGYIGYQWWNLTRAAVEYCVQFVDKHPEYLRFFRNAYMTDEVFFQTLLMNSPLKPTLVNNNLRHIHPEPFPNHFKCVDETDFDALQQSPALFARRFCAGTPTELLDTIDRRLLTATPT